VLLISEAAGGQARISEDDYGEGAPELIVEIAASSVAIDLHSKKHAYRRNGVKEYLVWQVLDQKINWFYLESGEYLELQANADGIWQSRTFPGLWLDRWALLNGNMQRVFEILQLGLQSPEHTAFVQRLSHF
jgi:Uma2 family endonuclease